MTELAPDRYPFEVLGDEDDDGTMPHNVTSLERKVVGRRIVRVEKRRVKKYWGITEVDAIVLDDGTEVQLHDGSDCCAYTELESFLLNPELVDHVITGVGTTDGYTTWHIYADAGDVLQLKVGWSCGNPFYYGYGFDIKVAPIGADAAPAKETTEPDGTVVTTVYQQVEEEVRQPHPTERTEEWERLETAYIDAKGASRADPENKELEHQYLLAQRDWRQMHNRIAQRAADERNTKGPGFRITDGGDR